MDFSSVTDLIDGMKEYYDSHNIRKSDIFMYEELKEGRNTDPRLRELIDRDRYGEYIGRCARSWIDSDKSGPKVSDLTFYLRPDGRVAGVWNSINGMFDAYEVFDYHDGYYTGAMYNIVGRMEQHMNFTYYIVNGDGRVTEMLNISGGMVARKGEYVLVRRTVVDCEGDETVLVSSTDLRYKKTGGGYKLIDESDNMAKSEPEDRVIDDQKELCKQLKKAVKTCGTLEEIVNTFFDVIKNARENPEEDITYTAGSSPYEAFGLPSECLFTLMRWTPAEDDEFYQLELNVTFDLNCEKIPYDNKYNVEGPAELRESVLSSESFNALKDKPIRKISVKVNET